MGNDEFQCSHSVERDTSRIVVIEINGQTVVLDFRSFEA
jgi:hypothetical protein